MLMIASHSQNLNSCFYILPECPHRTSHAQCQIFTNMICMRHSQTSCCSESCSNSSQCFTHKYFLNYTFSMQKIKNRNYKAAASPAEHNSLMTYKMIIGYTNSEICSSSSPLIQIKRFREQSIQLRLVLTFLLPSDPISKLQYHLPRRVLFKSNSNDKTVNSENFFTITNERW